MPNHMPPKQLSFPAPRTWGGRRKGAGRKRVSPRPNVPHTRRPTHAQAHPIHVTLRRHGDFPSLRNPRIFRVLKSAFQKSTKSNFRVIHFSVQSDHIHLVAESENRVVLARGIQGLAVRIARNVNKLVGRRGRVFGDRYHARDLRTPREVRNAIAYVLLNRAKHDPRSPGGGDFFSSGAWFDGWSVEIRRSDEPSPVARARTWLAGTGWRRCGLVRSDERPG